MSYPSSTHDRPQETDQVIWVYTTLSSLGPYLLSGAQKVQLQRVELCSSQLPMLEVQKQTVCHYVVTLDWS
jgi:hypothetical protein